MFFTRASIPSAQSKTLNDQHDSRAPEERSRRADPEEIARDEPDPDAGQGDLVRGDRCAPDGLHEEVGQRPVQHEIQGLFDLGGLEGGQVVRPQAPAALP